jgi:tRNA threonylcarbamoyladenosine biosynthesis protein TsaE
MRTTNKVSINTESAERTEEIASILGKNLKGGECIELVSDLGGGKTTFTRGLVIGLGSKDRVSSPTFTIGKRYVSGDITCYHFDFYRLQEPGLVAEELAEALEDPKAIIVVEWAQSVSEVLPDSRVIVAIEQVAGDPGARKLNIELPNNYSYILEGIS